jgi:endonuclease VIII
MPEGDTIYRAARTLHRALAGQPVIRFASVFPVLMHARVEGRTIDVVRSAGKHLLVEFSGDLVLRTHMRMNGSWHLYYRGDRWRRPRRDMRIVIETGSLEAVGFSIPVAELIPRSKLPHHEVLASLGPDLLSDDFDEAEALRRMRDMSEMPIADVLLNQRVVAGIGNVYKSEILFACRISPFAPTDQLNDETLLALVTTARRLLNSNTSESLAAMTTYTGFRKTTRRDDPSERLWVYGRARRPCRRCGTPIRMRRQGVHARSTYWCERCQPEEAT